MINPDWTYNYLTGAQSAANLQAVLPHDDKDTIISVGSHDSSNEVESIPQETRSVYKSTLGCFASNAIDGFLVGGLTAGAFSAFPFLIRAKFVQAAKAPFNSGNLKIAIYFSVLLGVYNTGRFHVRVKRRGNKRQLSSRALRVLVAICIGYSGSLLSNRVRRFIALFLLSRALETKSKDVYRSLTLSTQKALEPFVEHADVALTTLSMGINATGWIMAPDLLDKSYLRFLDNTCGYPVHALRSTTDLFNPAIKFSRHCEMLHPTNPNGCTVEISKFAVNHYFKDSIRFYYKLYAIPLLLTTVKKRRLSLTALKYFVQRTGRSALFLTTGGAAMTSVFCIFDKLGLKAHPALPFLGGMSSGAVVLIEPKSRRIELGLYLFTQSMHVIAMFYARQGWWYPPGTELLAIAIGFYQVISAYEDGGLLRPFYDSTLRKIFDYEEVGENRGKQTEDRMHSWSITKLLH